MSVADGAAPVTVVAVAVLCRADGAVLLAERPPGRPSAGFWEFPGGKVEAGEAVTDALARELHEELGVLPRDAWPWVCFEHGPPGRRVCLHFYRIGTWEGEPHGREGQRLAWVRPEAPAVAPLLPFNDRMLRALALPAVYGITDAARHGEDAFLARLEGALEKGLRMILVREPAFDRDRQLRFLREVVARAHPRDARVLMSGDEALAREAGADGVQLRAAQLMGARAAPLLGLWGASCHDERELARAAALGADFAVLSPVLPTASHPGVAGMGWDAFAARIRGWPMPVYALGGMRTDMVETAVRRGGHGIALLSGIW